MEFDPVYRGYDNGFDVTCEASSRRERGGERAWQGGAFQTSGVLSAWKIPGRKSACLLAATQPPTAVDYRHVDYGRGEICIGTEKERNNR